MTKFSEEERAIFARRVLAKIKDGKWTGMFTGSRKNAKGFTGRPADRMVTARSIAEQEQGDRVAGVYYEDRRSGIKRERPKKPYVNVPVSHVVLVHSGQFPTEEANTASHICHHNVCVDVAHLKWESSNHNSRRKRLCQKDRICRCRLDPRCRFDLHNENE